VESVIFFVEISLASKVSPSQPDPPSEVEVIAFDDDSVHLMWKPGFDGGFNQTFDLQVYQIKSK